MGDFPETLIQVGEVLYHPVVDLVYFGFAIEEFTVTKIVGHMHNPVGYPKFIWTYGDISFIKERAASREGRTKLFPAKRCFRTIEECIKVLDENRKQMIEHMNNKKDWAVAELTELKNFVKVTEQESKEIVRQSNKRLAMLHKLDISRDLEKRGLK